MDSRNNKDKRKRQGTPPSATKKKKQREAVQRDDSIGVQEKAKRAPNWLVDEDVILARAFVNASQNPIVGNDQKGSTFWKTVYQNFKALVENDDELVAFGRDQDACMNRFQRHMAKQTQVWNKYFREINNERPSGVPNDEWPNLATERFLEHEGYPFKFQSAALILHSMPKFNPMIDVEELDQDDFQEEGDGKKRLLLFCMCP